MGAIVESPTEEAAFVCPDSGPCAFAATGVGAVRDAVEAEGGVTVEVDDDDVGAVARVDGIEGFR